MTTEFDGEIDVPERAIQYIDDAVIASMFAFPPEPSLALAQTSVDIEILHTVISINTMCCTNVLNN